MEIWNNGKYVDRYNYLYKLREEEIKTYIKLLDLKVDDILIDFGCGNGDFLIACSDLVKVGVGIDSSLHQIKEFKKYKSKSNIRIIHDSFQKTSLKDVKYTKAFAGASLHHLTDQEKFNFFNKIKENFSNNALFLLHDVIFEFPENELKDRKELLIKEAEKYYGNNWEAKNKDVLNTWFNEYPSDYKTWKNIFKISGFRVIKYIKTTSFLGKILAKKID